MEMLKIVIRMSARGVACLLDGNLHILSCRASAEMLQHWDEKKQYGPFA